MPKYSTAFGMDVHLRSTTVCALDADTGEAVTRRFPGNPWGEIAGWMDGFPGPSLAAYESGYLGFAPQRELAGLGVECVVAAVSKIPRSAADSASKNDRNDAARMAKAILAHCAFQIEHVALRAFEVHIALALMNGLPEFLDLLNVDKLHNNASHACCSQIFNSLAVYSAMAEIARRKLYKSYSFACIYLLILTTR